jgi:hypothetical protein
LQGEIIKRFLDSIVIVTASAGHPSANACLELAKEANDIFARTAMMELAQEFNLAADEAEGPRRSITQSLVRATARSLRGRRVQCGGASRIVGRRFTCNAS